MTVSELRKKLDGVDDDTEVAVGVPVDGGVAPVPLADATDVKDQDGNPWLLFLPGGGCGGCEDAAGDGCGGCGGDEDDDGCGGG